MFRALRLGLKAFMSQTHAKTRESMPGSQQDFQTQWRDHTGWHSCPEIFSTFSELEKNVSPEIPNFSTENRIEAPKLGFGKLYGRPRGGSHENYRDFPS